ncbi:hypothetical protein S40288_05487 [Stachybotrys chartarum IBT 40288]|nr:hypothetical protein S40288_05487 [Stachybotrys chartarum IBT 40288]
MGSFISLTRSNGESDEGSDATNLNHSSSQFGSHTSPYSGSHSGSDSGSDSDLDDFQEVLKVVNWDQVAREAARIRLQMTRPDFAFNSSKWHHEDDSDAESVYEIPHTPALEIDGSCSEEEGFFDAVSEEDLPVLGFPLHGSYNIVFPLYFPDGVKWMLKIPHNGAPSQWNRTSAQDLTSEALTMRLIKQHTTVPVPEVYSFSSDGANPLGCPHIFMELIPGLNLYHQWHNEHMSDAERQALRNRVLEQLATIMLQLDQLTFSHGGRIIYRNESPVGMQSVTQSLGPSTDTAEESDMSKDKSIAEKDALSESPTVNAPEDFKNPKDADRLKEDAVLEKQDKADDNGLSEKGNMPKASNVSGNDASEHGQPRNAREWYTSSLSNDPIVCDDGHLDYAKCHEKGEEKLSLSWHPPDFDIQNILVSAEGAVLGLIDWDGVEAVPKSYGNRRYPGWLIKDWDPAMYGWRSDKSTSENRLDDCPAELARCRKVYLEVMKKLTKSDGLETRISLITNNLDAAICVPRLRSAILRKMLEEMDKLSGFQPHENEEDLVCFFEQYGERGLDDISLNYVQDMFTKMLNSESLGITLVAMSGTAPNDPSPGSHPTDRGVEQTSLDSKQHGQAQNVIDETKDTQGSVVDRNIGETIDAGKGKGGISGRVDDILNQTTAVGSTARGKGESVTGQGFRVGENVDAHDLASSKQP